MENIQYNAVVSSFLPFCNFVSTINSVYHSGQVCDFGLSVLFGGKYNTFAFLLNPVSER